VFCFISYDHYCILQVAAMFLAYHHGTPKISWNAKEEILKGLKLSYWAGHATMPPLPIHISWYK
jgi:hypothetical protein